MRIVVLTPEQVRAHITANILSLASGEAVGYNGEDRPMKTRLDELIELVLGYAKNMALGGNKIQAIKLVRTFLPLDLRSAKELVEDQLPAAPIGPTSSGIKVTLKDMGVKKIMVIRAIREITGGGLRETKELVESCHISEAVIKENCTYAEAEDIRQQIENVGATVEMTLA